MIPLRKSQYLLLPDVPDTDWKRISQRRNFVGQDDQTRFIISARKPFTKELLWRAFFDDRYDADVFLDALVRKTLRWQRGLWSLPTEMWIDGRGYCDDGWSPYLDVVCVLGFTSTTFLTTTSASNQTFTVPADWNNANNRVDVIASGAGGGGASTAGSGPAASGGGGAAWSGQSNITLTPSGSATYFVNVGGAAGSPNNNGGSGPDAWFNGTTLAGSTVGAKGGVNGQGGASASAGGAGGSAASGTGTNKASGGTGGTIGSGIQHAGGGGAAAGRGASGAGANGGNGGAGSGSGAGGGGGADGGSTGGSPTGGSGANGGGSGGNGGASTAGSPGTAGQEYDSTHGSGGGGGGGSSTNQPGGAGGNYGAAGGGGGVFSTSGGAGGAGTQGMNVVMWTPAPKVTGFNLAMLGM